jgi:hypothetical protein
MDTSSSDNSLPQDWLDRVGSELGDGERLIWAEQPRVGRYVRQSVPIVLFGMAFTAFALFWISAAWAMLFGIPGSGPNLEGPGLPFSLFPYFGVPFVLVGLGMLSSPFWYWRQAKRTCYALTSQRAMVWQAGMFGSLTVRSYGAEALGKIVRTEHPDGSGDLVLEQIVEEGTDSEGHRTTRIVRHGFIAISNVKQVEELVRQTLPPRGGR